MGFNCFEVTEPLKGENLLSLIHFCALFNCSTVTPPPLKQSIIP